MNNLTNLKLLLGLTGTEKDALLSVIYEQAEASFLNYTNRNSVPAEATAAVLELAVLRYNRVGTEGLDSHSYSNISETFSTEFNEGEKAMLNRWRRLRTL